MGFEQRNKARRRWLAAAMLLIATIGIACVVADDRTRPLVINTLLFSGGAASLSLPIGLVIALYLERTRLPGRSVADWLVLLMLFLPAYLQIAGWDAGLGMQGWLCRWWFPNQPVALLDGWPGAMWIQTCVNLPWVVLILRLGLATVPSGLEALASLDGSSLRVLREVTWPLLRPAALAAWLWVFVLAAGDVTVTDVYQIRTFAEEIYAGFALGDDLSTAPRRNLPGTLLILGLGGAAWFACQDVVQRLTSFDVRAPWHIARGAGTRERCLATLLCVTLIACLGLPIANLLLQAGRVVRWTDGVAVGSWSPARVLSILSQTPARFAEEFAWSFALAQLTAVAVVVGAMWLAWQGRRYRGIRWVAWAISLASLSIPAPLIALGVLRLVNQPGSDWLFYLYDRTLFAPWLALSLRTFPFAWIASEWAVRSVKMQLVEIAQLSGASRWQQFRFVIFPQLVQPFAWLWLLIMALAIADLSTTVLSVPPGVTTLSIRIFNLVHYGVNDQLAGLSLGTMALFAGLAALARRFFPGRSAP